MNYIDQYLETGEHPVHTRASVTYHEVSDDLLAETSSKPKSTQFLQERPSSYMECTSNPTRVKIEPSHVGTQPDGEFDTCSGLSVNQQQERSLFRQLTHETRNTRLSLDSIGAVVEPQIDVSS